MDNNPDVLQGSSPVASEGVTPQEGLPVAPVVTTDIPTPGSQTPEANLLAALKEERARRKELEEQLNNNATNPAEDEIFSDEGKALKKQLDDLQLKFNQQEDEKELQKVHSQFPDVKELSAEFDEFRKDYPRHKLENVAKLFRAEKGLLEPVRKGLEQPTGGTRTPMTSGMTADDVKTLRETNFKKYQEMLMNGQLKLD